MSEETKPAVDVSDKYMHPDAAMFGLVPAADCQRVVAEAAAMRRALEAQTEVRWTIGCHDGHVDHSTTGAGREGACKQCVAEALREAALKPDTGQQLLSELADLRRERDALKADRDEWAAREEFQSNRCKTYREEREASRDAYERQHRITEQIAAERDAARADSADLRARLERLEGRRFPIQGGPSIPWAMIAPHEAQAKTNHDQSLERLAERGGLSPGEAVAVLDGLRWREARVISEADGRARLAAHLERWEASQRQPPPGYVPADEVRRAVQVEREACAAEIRSRRDESSDEHAAEIFAAAILARGGA